MFCYLNPHCCGKDSHLWSSKLLLKNHQDRKQVLVLKPHKTVKSCKITIFWWNRQFFGWIWVESLESSTRISWWNQASTPMSAAVRTVRSGGGVDAGSPSWSSKWNFLSLIWDFHIWDSSWITLEKHGEHGNFMGFHGGFWMFLGGIPMDFPMVLRGRSPCSKAVALQLRLWPENSDPAEFHGDDVGWWLRWPGTGTQKKNQQ